MAIVMRLFQHHFHALGSDCALQIFAEEDADAISAAVAAEREIVRIEERFSRYRSGSELSRINEVAHGGGTIEVDTETAGLIDYAYACFRKSEGLFDITSGILRKAWDFSSGRLPEQSAIAALLPRVGLDKIRWDKPRLTFPLPAMELDFGGIGKEYAADRAVGICKAMGIQYGLIDLGGDICLIGPRSDGGPWNVGVRHPRDPAIPMANVDLLTGALATSGDYERFVEANGRRYCHILNPGTGWPVRGLTSVSVIAEGCLVAGSLATVAMLKGDHGVAWLRALGARYVCMDEHGTLHRSDQNEELCGGV
jgi:thiamine biosynthesis lipoprotein